MITKNIAREHVESEVLAKVGTRIFGAEFVKKDGTVRKGAFRFGVKKHLRGGVNKVEREDRPYRTVFDMRKKGYRTLNIRTLQKLKINNIEYIIV